MKKLLICLTVALAAWMGDAASGLAAGSDKGDGAARFLRTVSQKLEEDNDAWMLAHTSKAIQKAARDYCEGDYNMKCYAWYILRTGSQDQDDLVSVKKAGNGWYVVRRRHNDGYVDIRMRVVPKGKSYKITGLINPDRDISIR